ncbi:MAG TPA: hypothetical protein VFE78_36100, partial [Gemmataceae bacterium]|nr:hypothetical protein [Gemmataceae bacterium]
IEVPDGATVTVKDKDGKTVARVGPEKNPPAAGADADRKAAEWALSLGGVVRTDGEERDIKAAADLPKGVSSVLGPGHFRGVARARPRADDRGVARRRGGSAGLGAAASRAG